MIEEVVPVEVVRSFRNLAARHLGLAIDKEWEPVVCARITKRLKQLQLPLHRYLYRLYQEKDAGEIVSFWDFVRPRPLALFAPWSDYEQLHAHVLHRLASGQRRFRFWSAGCGSGEQAYAMALTAEHAASVEGVETSSLDLKILATDLSAIAIASGKRGVFDRMQVQHVPQDLRRRHFFRSSGGFAISDDIQSRVVFRVLNLAQPPFPMTRPFDAIFCHEGLAPLVPEARTRALRATQDLLCKDGFLRAGFDIPLGSSGEPSQKLPDDRSTSATTPPRYC